MAQRRIVIVGGGTAGWLTAAYLARRLRAAEPDGCAITLIESPDIGTIGVGEGTFPTIRATLASLGVDEARFLRESSATFKQGVRFYNWARTPGEVGGDEYFHPFNLPYREPGLDLSAYWLKSGQNRAFADAMTMQGAVIRAGLAPKRASDPDFEGPMNYAYHFDAVRFAGFLRKVSKDLGVVHLTGAVNAVLQDEQGDISAVESAEHGRLEADLFIDCSGFRALMIGQALGSTFRPCDDVLFNDRALAMQVAYADPDAPIAPYTIATAHEAGWTWDIGLNDRRGIGYVFSSRHSDETRAEEVLRAYVGPQASGLSARLLKFQTGYRERQWIGNCVAVGLSAGFFEPLESTGIMLIEVAAALIAEFFATPDRDAMAAAARSFNSQMLARFDRILDFLKLHYCVSGRRDTAYWRDNADQASIPQSLRDRLTQWRLRPVSAFDFVTDLETFLPASYEYILYGMGVRAEAGAWSGRYRNDAVAARAFHKVDQASAEALKHLPSHRQLVELYRARVPL
ncbi:MAG TPA: tryptophan halogenase family protein [Caulobacteraceae bacterium]|jgi:flavin-dependent dehydrogenase